MTKEEEKLYYEVFDGMDAKRQTDYIEQCRKELRDLEHAHATRAERLIRLEKRRKKEDAQG